jgi:hypothetical protein
MAAQSTPLHGTVFISYLGPLFWCYWDSLPDEPARVLAELPPQRDVAPLIAWARQRASRILVRMPDQQHYWAGDAPLPDDVVPWEDTLLDQGRPAHEAIGPSKSVRFVCRCDDCGWQQEVESDRAAFAAKSEHALRRCRSKALGV